MTSVQFQKSTAALLAALYACSPHYIRCIKSNDKREALSVNDARVMQQVQYLGLSEQIKVRRAGFAYRCTYERWLKRYGMCDARCYPSYVGLAKDGAVIILNTMGIDKSGYEFGTSKLFIRDPKVGAARLAARWR